MFLLTLIKRMFLDNFLWICGIFSLLVIFFPLQQKFLEHDFLLENLSYKAPVYIITEGSEPPFFTRFFTWDSAKSSVSIQQLLTSVYMPTKYLQETNVFNRKQMHGNSFQRKLTIVKSGGTPAVDVRLL